MSNIEKKLPASEVTLKSTIEKIKISYNYLLSKWILIVVIGFLGAAIGLGLSLISKPKYTAHLSFALIERSSPGALAGLASSFGLSGMFGANSGSAFSGDNLLEIIKSRYAVEKTLLTPVEYDGEKKTLMDVYIEVNKFHENWKKSKKTELWTLNYPVNQQRETFTRVQDSVLYSVYSSFVKNNALTVVRKDKKIGIVNVDFTTKNEQFSKLFVDYLMEQTTQFYSETRTAQSRFNIEMMEHTADSIKNLYEDALFRGASISQVNVNTALQTAVVPRLKHENNAQLYGAVYAEVLKNLETLKLDMARETPIVQIIDTPRYPLKMKKIGKAKGIVFGGFTGGVLIVVFLLGWYNLKEMLK